MKERQSQDQRAEITGEHYINWRDWMTAPEIKKKCTHITTIVGQGFTAGVSSVKHLRDLSDAHG